LGTPVFGTVALLVIAGCPVMTGSRWWKERWCITYSWSIFYVPAENVMPAYCLSPSLIAY